MLANSGAPEMASALLKTVPCLRVGFVAGHGLEQLRRQLHEGAGVHQRLPAAHPLGLVAPL
eukprot:213796-Lingulodinium_polyedra.AAC.1